MSFWTKNLYIAYMWFFIYLLLSELIIRALSWVQEYCTAPAPLSREHALPLAPRVHEHESTRAPEPRVREEMLEAPEDTSSDQQGTANWVVTEVGPLRVNYETWKKYK